MKDHDNFISRRDLLRCIAGAGIALSLSATATIAKAAGAQLVSVGAAAKFKKNEPQKVTLPGNKPVFIRRIDSKTIIAISAICTHKGCTINWNAEGFKFICPCHGATFTPDGKNISGPANRPLTVAPTVLKKGNVLVDAQLF